MPTAHAPSADLPVETEDTDHMNGLDDIDETEEVEVLGIQLTREDQPSDCGSRGAGVAQFAVDVLLDTDGRVLWSRHP